MRSRRHSNSIPLLVVVFRLPMALIFDSLVYFWWLEFGLAPTSSLPSFTLLFVASLGTGPGFLESYSDAARNALVFLAIGILASRFHEPGELVHRSRRLM